MNNHKIVAGDSLSPRENPLPVFHATAFTALVAGACCIAFAGILVRLSPVGPSATAFWRLIFSLPILLPLMLHQVSRHQHRKMPAPPVKVYLLLIIPGFFFAGDLILWHWSLQFTAVANATLLPNMAPIFVTIAAWVLFRDRITKGFLAGLCTAVFGAFVLMSNSLQISREYFLGDMIGILTALFYGAYQLSVARLRSRFATATFMCHTAAWSALFVLPVALLSGESLLWENMTDWRTWGVLLGLGFFSHACGQGLIVYALAHLPASFASTSLLVQPAVAAVAAWIILTEPIGIGQLLGGLIILGGIMIARRGTFAAKAKLE